MTSTRIVPVPEFCQVLLGVATAQRIGGEWPPPPDDLLRQFGASEERIRALSARPYIRSFPSVAPIHIADVIALQTRREAFAEADLYDGIVLDLTVPWVIPSGEPDLAVTAQWVAFLDGDDAVTSRGLTTFGLPELRWPGTTEQPVPVRSLLIGLAHRLIGHWPDHDPVGVVTVTPADIASALGRPADPAWPDVEVEVSYDGTSLVVTPAGR